MSATDTTVAAPPYSARQCPDCKVWVYCDAGPFAEDGDPTKPYADCLHWEAEHASDEEKGGAVFGFPFFMYNEEPVEAVHEARAKDEDARVRPSYTDGPSW